MDDAALLTTLAGRLGLPSGAVQTGAPLSLTVDGDMTLVVEPLAAGGCCFLADVATLSVSGREAPMRRMLERNLLQRQHSASFLSLDPRRDMAVLCRRVVTTDYLTFETQFEAFLGEATELRRQFATAAPDQPAAAGVDSAGVEDASWLRTAMRL